MSETEARCSDHTRRCARCSNLIVCPACSFTGQDTRGIWPGYCGSCARQPVAVPAPTPSPVVEATPAAEASAAVVIEDAVGNPRLLVRRPINAREILTTERLNIGREAALVRYLRAMRANEPVRPVAVTPSFWIRDALAAEMARRRPRSGILTRMEEASSLLARSQFCLLDGDHRALAAALFDRPVNAVVVETPAHLDALRREDPAFPHEEGDLLQLGRKWLDYAFGSLEQSAFDVHPYTVAERAEQIARSRLLPRAAAELLDRARTDRTSRPTTDRCTCPPAPSAPGGTTWSDYARGRSTCPRHARA